jgi:organic radical activating enzyme
MVVNDTFWSVQGEGSRTGVPSIFLRLTGCTLQCPYCDTPDAWKGGKKMEIQEVVTKIKVLKKEYPRSQVVITGGEPLEQDLSELVDKLNQQKFYLAIETNGIYFQDLNINWWTLSPKDLGDYYISANLKERISEIKLIVNRNLNLGVIKKIRAIRKDFPIFLQPDCFAKNKYKNTFKLFEECQKAGIANIKLGYQLHKIFNIK